VSLCLDVLAIDVLAIDVLAIDAFQSPLHCLLLNVLCVCVRDDDDDDVFYLFLQKQKSGQRYIPKGTSHHTRLFRGTSTNDMKT
jgi:hypothetical protein